MAGVKGRSGGPRRNSGGVRPGAGRPPKPKVLLDLLGDPVSVPGTDKEPETVDFERSFDDPETFLRTIMNTTEADLKLRVDAAKALMPYVHAKRGESGKKESRQEAAENVAGRFNAAAPPRLIVSDGKKI